MSRALKAALAYAGMFGWRMHPCEPSGKIPLLKRWPERATTDAATIRAWWQRWPDANVAVATGPGSGLLVLDVDGPEGEASLAEMERQHGQLPDCPMQWTGSGIGWQAFLAYPEGRQIGNSAGKLGAKLDTRGTGGYVLLPPSVTMQPYHWAEGRSPRDLPPAPAPAWLLDLLDPPADTARPPAHTFDPRACRPARRIESYIETALDDELGAVAGAPNGQRNATLNRAAFILFRFALTGQLARHEIEAPLAAAARAAGLTEHEIALTLHSAARARGLAA